MSGCTCCCPTLSSLFSLSPTLRKSSSCAQAMGSFPMSLAMTCSELFPKVVELRHSTHLQALSKVEMKVSAPSEVCRALSLWQTLELDVHRPSSTRVWQQLVSWLGSCCCWPIQGNVAWLLNWVFCAGKSVAVILYWLEDWTSSRTSCQHIWTSFPLFAG